jgi:hypothetical protein
LAKPPGDPRRSRPAESTSGFFFFEINCRNLGLTPSVFKKKFSSVDPVGRLRRSTPLESPGGSANQEPSFSRPQAGSTSGIFFSRFARARFACSASPAAGGTPSASLRGASDQPPPQPPLPPNTNTHAAHNTKPSRVVNLLPFSNGAHLLSTRPGLFLVLFLAASPRAGTPPAPAPLYLYPPPSRPRCAHGMHTPPPTRSRAPPA